MVVDELAVGEVPSYLFVPFKLKKASKTEDRDVLTYHGWTQPIRRESEKRGYQTPAQYRERGVKAAR